MIKHLLNSQYSVSEAANTKSRWKMTELSIFLGEWERIPHLMQFSNFLSVLASFQGGMEWKKIEELGEKEILSILRTFLPRGKKK